MDMRRFLLLITGALWSVGFLGLLCSNAIAQYAAAREPVLQTRPLALPCQVADTQLTAQQLVIYEGSFREDGSNREVGEIASLLITNHGGTMVTEGAVILDWGKDRMVFEIFGLPAGGTALVQEKDEKRFWGQEFTTVYGWNRTEYPENMGAVAVEEAGGSCMLVINRSNSTIPFTHIRFKSWDQESGIYIGGICHSVEVENLRPGETRIISPGHFVCGYSRVICITTETEK